MTGAAHKYRGNVMITIGGWLAQMHCVGRELGGKLALVFFIFFIIIVTGRLLNYA